MAIDLNTFKTSMGWNQLVAIDFTAATSLFTGTDFNAPLNPFILRVESYDIGVRQTPEAPDYVTGASDRTAWRKGPITSDGSLTFPFTLPPSGSSYAQGLSLFLCAAQLVKSPQSSFTITSTAHPSISGCKVATARIECQAEQPIVTNATVWGIVDEEELQTIHSYGDPSRIVWGPGATSTVLNTTGGQGGTIYMPLSSHEIDGTNYPDPASPSGLFITDTLALEQIPMFDVVSIQGAPKEMFITGFSLEIDNALKRNYTMGSGTETTNQSEYSPFGLNATSISANQRTVKGTLTWQSSYEGYVSQILSTGIDKLIIQVGPVLFELNQVMWSAQPPTLGATDRITVESAFTALGTGQGTDGFDALVISKVTFP